MADSKVVVVTGASAGIGAALARRLGRDGHRLVLAARRAAELEAVARECGEALAVPTDVTRREEVERLRDEAVRAFGAIDAWVNNAGRGITRSVLQLTDAEVDEMLAVNVKSALYGMQAVVPHFIERGRGHLINVSSFLGRVPLVPHRSAYSAAKAALNSLTASLRLELARSHPGIHVSLVMPGIVSTEFAANALGERTARHPASAAMGAQSAEEVAERIAALLDHPAAEIYTNEASPGIARAYHADVAAFEKAQGERGLPPRAP